MSDQGLVTFAGQTNIIGATMPWCRGVQPSVGLIRMIPKTTFDRVNGTLQFTYGGTTISLPDCAVMESQNRPFYGRDKWRWSVKVVDRRWKWRYPRIDGVYNERTCGGGLQTANKKNAKQLCDLLLDAMGESGYDTSSVSTVVYPPVVWNRARAALELQWICDLIGHVVVLGLDNVVRIEPLNDPSGASMPSGNVITPDTFYHKSAVIPQNLRVQGNPTVIQSKLFLEAVGIDDDGKIKTLGNLSYKPTTWGDEWYGAFPSVSQDKRHYAFDTVWRWFKPKSGWSGDGVTIDDASQLELLEWAAESYLDPDGRYRCVRPQVGGIFWPNCDHSINTPTDAIYAGPFKVHSNLGLIEFAHPVVKWSATEFAEPDLWIKCAYRVREPDSDGYSVYQRDLGVTKSNASTEYRVLPHPELTKVKIIDSIHGLSGDNLAALHAEADVYLNTTEATYDFTNSQDIHYNGLLKQELDGAISQLKWWCGHGRPAMTRIGRNTEFDSYSLHHQQKRALERLAQMAEKQSL